MNIIRTETASKAIVVLILVTFVVFAAFWFHSNAITMGVSQNSVPCGLCH